MHFLGRETDQNMSSIFIISKTSYHGEWNASIIFYYCGSKFIKMYCPYWMSDLENHWYWQLDKINNFYLARFHGSAFILDSALERPQDLRSLFTYKCAMVMCSPFFNWESLLALFKKRYVHAPWILLCLFTKKSCILQSFRSLFR